MEKELQELIEAAKAFGKDQSIGNRARLNSAIFNVRFAMGDNDGNKKKVIEVSLPVVEVCNECRKALVDLTDCEICGCEY